MSELPRPTDRAALRRAVAPADDGALMRDSGRLMLLRGVAAVLGVLMLGAAGYLSLARGGAVEPAAPEAASDHDALERGAEATTASSNAPPQPPTAAPAPAPRQPRLVGRVMIPAGFTPEDFHVTHRRPGVVEETPIRILAGNPFRVYDLEPGDLTVTVRALGDPLPLRTVDVVIPAQGTNADPRLQRMTFPELRVARIELVTPAEAPVGVQATGLSLWSTGDRGMRFHSGPNESLAVKARYQPQRVVVWARGFALQEIEVHDAARVVMPAPAIVELQLTIDPGVFSGGRHVGVWLEPADDRPRGAPPPPAGFPMSDASGGPADYVFGAAEGGVRGLMNANPPGPLFFPVARSGLCRVRWAVYRSIFGGAALGVGYGPALVVTLGERHRQSLLLSPQMVDAGAAEAAAANAAALQPRK